MSVPRFRLAAPFIVLPAVEALDGLTELHLLDAFTRLAVPACAVKGRRK